jgi:hypothetical protein
MGRVIHCNKISQSCECDHVILGETEDDVIRKAGVHAKGHGPVPTPELIEKVRASIGDEQAAAQS